MSDFLKYRFGDTPFSEMISQLPSPEPLEAECGERLGYIMTTEWQRLVPKDQDFAEKNTDQSAAPPSNLETLNQELTHYMQDHERDLKMAAHVQESLLDFHPAIDDYETAVHYEAIHNVSGDFFDFYQQNRQLLGVCLSDVCGHGISSGLLTVMAKPIFERMFYKHRDSPLNEVMTRINRQLQDVYRENDKYLTAVLLRFSGNAVEYCNAARPDVLHLPADGTPPRIVSGSRGRIQGNLMGMKRFSTEYELCRFTLSPGDILILMTDGVLEGEKKTTTIEGTNRLCSTLNHLSRNDPLQSFIDVILDDYYNALGSDKMKDDKSIIMLRKR